MVAGAPVVIVTGGMGFIGSNLVAHLVEGADVVVCDWPGQDERWRNIAKHEIADLAVHFDQGMPGNRGIVGCIAGLAGYGRVPEFEIRHVNVDNAFQQLQGSDAIIATAVVHERDMQSFFSCQVNGG